MEKFPKPITKGCVKKIFEQMNYSIYRLNEKEDNYTNCIFTFIKYENKKIPVAIINNTKEYKDKLNVSINNENKIIELSHTKYKSKKYGITIIEITENKNNKKLNFIEIDEGIYNEELLQMNYSEESIYIIQYKKKENLITNGLIKNIDNFEMRYSGNILQDKKGSPIFNLSNNKLIGIHENVSTYYNKGIFLKDIINKFINKYKYKSIRYKYNNIINNEIDIDLKIEKENINKKIYFLDNYEEDEHFHDNLKELNEYNTELYINNQKSKYEKYIIPEKEVEYKIKLKFNTLLKDCSYMFYNCININKIDFIYFNTKNVEDMKYMFNGCTFKNINLSGY